MFLPNCRARQADEHGAGVSAWWAGSASVLEQHRKNKVLTHSAKQEGRWEVFLLSAKPWKPPAPPAPPPSVEGQQQQQTCG